LRKKLLYGALLVALIFARGELTQRAGWLEGVEAVYYDLWHQLSGPRYPAAHVVLVVVDDQTRLEHQDEPLVFWSPHFARAVQVLRRAGARVMGLDYLFSVSAESWLKKLKLPETDQSRTFDLPFREQLASGQVVLAASLAADAQGKETVLLPLPDYLGSLPGKLEDVGLVNFYNDPDGVVRRFVPALATAGGEAWGTFAQLLAERAATGVPAPSGLTPIGFAGPPGTVPRVPLRRLLAPSADIDPTVLALKDKVVIIASETTGFQDIHMTPYARSLPYLQARMMSGAELHAHIVETLLTGRHPRPAPPWLRLTLQLGFLVLGAVLFFRLSPRWGLAILVLLGAAPAALAFLLFQGWRLLPVFSTQMGLGLCYLGVLGFRLTREERERARLRQLFGRYVSDAVAEKLVASGKPPDLGGEALKVTVLFSDIRNFTTLSESLSPHQVVELLNAYFTRVCNPILEQGGCVDKFIGDAVMAVFGSPAPQPDHARRALKAALAMAQMAGEFRAWVAARFPGQGLPGFSIGIGVHTGEVVVGNIGSPTRLDFTAIGDTVNTASRLEGLTKELGWTIVASSATLAAAGPGVATRGRQSVRLKGRQEPVEVFEVTGLEE
jgi:adenylate cyclase